MAKYTYVFDEPEAKKPKYSYVFEEEPKEKVKSSYGASGSWEEPKEPGIIQKANKIVGDIGKGLGLSIPAGLAETAASGAKLAELGSELTGGDKTLMPWWTKLIPESVLAPTKGLIGNLSKTTSPLLPGEDTPASEVFGESFSDAIYKSLASLEEKTGELSVPGQFAYQIGKPVTNIVMTGLAGRALAAGLRSAAASEIIQMTPFMVSAAGSYAKEAELEGATPLQQAAYGTIMGIAEGATEKIPFDKWFGLIGGKRGIMYWIKSMSAEGLQELIMDPVAGMVKKGLRIKPDMPWKGEGGVFDLGQMIQSGAGGIGTGALMAGGSAVTNRVLNLLERQKLQEGQKNQAQQTEAPVMYPLEQLVEQPQQYTGPERRVDLDTRRRVDNGEVTPEQLAELRRQKEFLEQRKAEREPDSQPTLENTVKEQVKKDLGKGKTNLKISKNELSKVKVGDTIYDTNNRTWEVIGLDSAGFKVKSPHGAETFLGINSVRLTKSEKEIPSTTPKNAIQGQEVSEGTNISPTTQKKQEPAKAPKISTPKTLKEKKGQVNPAALTEEDWKQLDSLKDTYQVGAKEPELSPGLEKVLSEIPEKETTGPSTNTVEIVKQKYIKLGWEEDVAQKSAEKLADAIDNGNYNNLLHPDNKKSRAIYEEITGKKLPKTIKGTREVLRGEYVEPEKSKRYKIFTNRGQVNVNGFKIESPEGLEEFEFFVHKDIENQKKWRVSEKETGLNAIIGRDSKNEAVHYFNKLVETNGASKFKNAILKAKRMDGKEWGQADATPATKNLKEKQEQAKSDLEKPIVKKTEPSKTLKERQEQVKKVSVELGVPPLSSNPAEVTPEQFEAYTKLVGTAIDNIKEMIRSDKFPTGERVQGKIREIVDKELGRKATEDEVTDIVEAAIQQYIAEGLGYYPIENRVKSAMELEKHLLPNFSRSIEKTDRQQFSTPAQLAQIVSNLAGIREGDNVLESSAGTGSLLEAVINPNKKANITAVELEPRRAAILKSRGHNVLNQDTFTYMPKEKADVIIMNPPFRGASRMKDSERAGSSPWPGGWGDLGNRFINFDLRRLKDGGRLVSVVSPGVVDPSNKVNAPFRQWLEKNHTVVAMIVLPEDVYNTRGTHFGAGLLVIEKGKRTDVKPVIAQPKTWDELFDVLKGVAKREVVSSKPEPAKTVEGAGASSSSGRSGETEVKTSGKGSNIERDTNMVSSGSSTPRGTQPGGTVPVPVPSGEKPLPTTLGDRRNDVQKPISGSSSSVEAGSREGIQSPSTPELETGESRERAAASTDGFSEDESDVSTVSFVDYIPPKVSGRQSPGKVVEPPTLALVQAPDYLKIDPKLKPHPKVMQTGPEGIGLSDVQLEVVMAAKYNHQKGRGILLGDDTGVGKTGSILGIVGDGYFSGEFDRQVIIANKAGWIVDECAEDNKKFGINLPYTNVHENPIYEPSSNEYAAPQAKEEIVNGKVRKTKEKIFDFANHEPREGWSPFPETDGVLIMTPEDLAKYSYAVYRWLKNSKKESRIVVDEAHNFINVPDEAAKDKGSDKATILRNLWRDLKPDKGTQFIYATATSGQSLDDIEYLYDLGLWDTSSWGEKSFPAWKNSILGQQYEGRAKGGRWGKSKNDPYSRNVPLTIMEQIVRELKSEGQYFGRQQSLEGTEIEALPVELTSKQKGELNSVVEMVNLIAGKIGAYGGSRMSVIGGILGYMRRISGHYRLQTAINHAKQQLAEAQKEGKKIRIVFSVDNFHAVSSRAPIIENLIDKVPTATRSDDGELIEIPEAKFDKEELRAILDGQNPEYPNPLPELPDMIDEIKKAFGIDKVGLITGDVSTRGRSEAKREFRETTKPIIVISKAGSTGLNLHDTTGDRVYFYHVDYDYDAKIFKQREGRVNRTGQKTAPKIFYPYINTGIDTRFIGTIMARMEQMGAIARGKAIKVSNENLQQFNVTGAAARLATARALARLDAPLRERMIGTSKNEGEEFEKVVVRLGAKDYMNRLMLLSYDDSIQARDVFMEELTEARKNIEQIGGIIDDFTTYHGEVVSESKAGEGIRLLRIKVNDKAIINKAEKDFADATLKLSNAKQAYNETIEKVKARVAQKLAKAEAAYEKINNEVEAIIEKIRNTDYNAPGRDELIKKYRELQSKRFEASNARNQLKPLYNESEEDFLLKFAEVSRAKRRLDEAQHRYDTKKHTLDYAREAVLIDGKVVTNGLMVDIREAIRTAGISKNVPEAAWNLEFRGYVLQDGSRAVGPVIPEFAEEEVAKVLGASIKTKEVKQEDVWNELTEKKRDIKLSNGVELSFSSYQNAVTIKGISSTDPVIRNWYLNEARPDIEFNSVSRVFLVKNEEGLKKVLAKWPLASGVDSVKGMPGGSRSIKHTPANSKINPVKRVEIIDYIEKKLGTPIRYKRLVDKRHAGEYKVRSEVTRIRKPEDLTVIAHELGHHLIKTLELDPDNYNELRTLGKALYPNANASKQREEGMAEFFRLYFTNPSASEKAAPTFYRDFENILKSDGELSGKIKQVQNMYYDYIHQNAVSYIRSHIVEKAPKERGLLDKKSKAYTALMDDLHPIYRAMEELIGRKLSNEEEVAILENPYILSRLARASKRAATAMLTHKSVNPDLEISGPSYREIMKPVSGSIEEVERFETYLVAKRAVEINSQGKESGFDNTMAEAVVDELENQTYIEVAKQRQAYKDNLLSWLVDSGFYSQSTIDMWRDLNKYHVPFYRVFGEESATGNMGSGRKLAGISSPVKRLKGSSRSIYSPIDSDVKDTFYFLDVAKRNKVMGVLADLADKAEGKGWLMERVPIPFEANPVELQKLKDNLIEAGIPEEILDSADLERTALLFNPVRFARIKEAKEYILPVRRKGEVSFYRVHPELYRAVMALDAPNIRPLIRLFGAVANILKVGVLSSPKFAVRNIVKDTGTRVSITRGKVWQLPKAIIRGLCHVVKRSDQYVIAEVAGALQAGMVNLNRDNLHDYALGVLNLYSPKQKIARAISAPLRALEYLLEVSDEMTRMGEDLTVAEARGNTKQAKLEAAYASRESGLDFKRMGGSVREANMIWAFFNQALQGPDKMIREFRKNPVQFVLRGLLLTMISLVTYGINRDKDEYAEEQSYRKDLNWIFYVNGRPIYIPKPYDTGIIFGSLVERTLEALDKKDPELVTNLLETVKDVSLPNLIPTALLAAFEVQTNYNMFTGRPIVPRGLQNLPEPMQYNYRTSEAAKFAGRLTNQSPLKIEHLVRGYTGTMGTHTLDFIDLLAGEVRKKKTWSEIIPGVNALVGKSFQSSESIDRFYDKLSEYEKQYQSFKSGRGKFPNKLQLFRNTAKILSANNKLIKRIQKDATLSAEEKQKRTDKIYLKNINHARTALGKEPLKRTAKH